MKKYSVVALLAAFVLAALSSCSSAPKVDPASEAPAATAQPAPADSMNLGASSSGRAR